MTTHIERLKIIGLIAGIFLIALIISLMGQKTALGSAPSGLPMTIATSTMLGLASRTSTTLIATTTCSARIITTTNSVVMLTFSDYNGASPTGTFGHLQAASTTVAYDSGQFGCGKVKAFADSATTITFTDGN